MNNPFQQDDIVYDVEFGEGTVCNVVQDRVEVIFERGDKRNCKYTILSFVPFNEPVHERPIKIGWHVTRANPPAPWGTSNTVHYFTGEYWTTTPNNPILQETKLDKNWIKSIRFITSNLDITK